MIRRNIFAFDDTAVLNHLFGSRDFDVLANDADPNGAPLFLLEVEVLDPTKGSASVNADNTVRFDPAPGFSGDAIISYVAGSAAGATDTANLTVTVTENFAPFIVEPVFFDVLPGETTVGDLFAFDLEGDEITWSISGGPDAALFSIDPTVGALSFVAPPDASVPLDAGGDNIYEVTVRASDSFGFDEQAYQVSVLEPCDCPPGGVEFDPEFKKQSGYFEFFLSEGAVGDLITFTATSTNSAPIEYLLLGEDAHLFELDPTTGELSLAQEIPGLRGSFDTDGVYELIILATDNTGGDDDYIEVLLPLFASG